MLNFLTLKPEAFGLDISDLSLKIVKLKKKGKFLDLVSFGETAINPGIIKRGEIQDEEKLSGIIREVLAKVKGEKLKTKYVIASLPEEKAFLQVIQMPPISEKDLESAVIYEAENYIPLPIEQVYLDSQIVLPVQNHLSHTDVLLAALPKKTVDPYVSCLKRAGLQPLSLEIESLAISRALIKGGATNYPVLLVDLGATRTGFVVFSGRTLRFTSSILVSAGNFTEIIAKNLAVNLAEAEELKIKYGLEEKVKVKITNGTKLEKERGKVFEALVPALVDLTQQIKKYLEYYQDHASHEHLPPNGSGVKKVLLCGGGANLKGLPELLTLELKMPVELGDPWVNILPKDKKPVPQLPIEKALRYATCLGLALRGVSI